MRPYSEWVINPPHMTRAEKKKASRRKWVLENPDKVKAARKKWRETNPDKVKAHVKTTTKHADKIRNNAKEKAREFRLTEAWRVKKKLEQERFRRKQELRMGRPRPPKCEMVNCDKIDVVYDHDHATNLARGWPCNHCNVVLGLVGDSSALLRELADYIDNFVASQDKVAA